MVAITTFAQAGSTIREGDELPRTDPMVTSHTSYFVPACTPKSDWPEPLGALHSAPEPAPLAPVVVATRAHFSPQPATR
jgi:hypothetical protein